MKNKRENIGHWRSTLYQEKNHYKINLHGVIPTTNPGANCRLICMEEFSDPDTSLIYRLEEAQAINVESEAQTYLVSSRTITGQCPYKKIAIIGFRPGERHSFLIAIVKIEEGIGEL
ncbi:hypothetical protein [Pedobacter paludis]|uniref:hypothetical protein n=1 Tax=Pedobacter paludis TaxID=2203212 RepID=UPI0011B1CE3B|nr:hypothetical protein [Pedobacter paludis]